MTDLSPTDKQMWRIKRSYEQKKIYNGTLGTLGK